MSTPTDPSDDHATDAADLEVRSDGAHDPIVDDVANLAPGQVGADVEPDTIGGSRPVEEEDRERLVERLREQHD